MLNLTALSGDWLYDDIVQEKGIIEVLNGGILLEATIKIEEGDIFLE